MVKKLILMIGIMLHISSCGDDEKDLRVYDSVRINVPSGIDGSNTKLNVYIELDSIETVIPNSRFSVFPTPFKQQFSINMEIVTPDYYKIVLLNLADNEVVFTDERQYEKGNNLFDIDPNYGNILNNGFYEVQIHRNLEIIYRTKVLYWNKDNFELDEDKNLLNIWSDYINDKSYFNIETDFKFLLNNKLERILPNGVVMQSYYMKSYIVVSIEDYQRNVIKEKRIRFDEFASKTEFNFN